MERLTMPLALACILSIPIGAQEVTSLTPAQQGLMEAAYLGQLDEVKRLASAGTAVDFTDPERRTPFMWAAFNGHIAVLQFLLEQGAQVDAKDVNGRTALMYASSGPFAEAVGLLLQHGAEVNVQGTLEGFTALMTAASEGLIDVVQQLLAHGADPSLVDKDGDTALSFARQNNHAEVIDLLESIPAPSR